MMSDVLLVYVFIMVLFSTSALAVGAYGSIDSDRCNENTLCFHVGKSGNFVKSLGEIPNTRKKAPG